MGIFMAFDSVIVACDRTSTPLTDLAQCLNATSDDRMITRKGKRYDKIKEKEGRHEEDSRSVQSSPVTFKSLYPEEFSLFSHLETASSIPSVLFAITTWKENGRPNICFHAWSSFCGEPGSFHAVLGNLYQHTHTYANILRERCFGLSFLPLSAYAQLVETITHNEAECDEFAAGGFTVQQARCIHAPLIAEAFLSMECTLKQTIDLSGNGRSALVIGEVCHLWVEEAFAHGYARHGEEGFMFLVPAPQDLQSGKADRSAIATLRIEKVD